MISYQGAVTRFSVDDRRHAAQCRDGSRRHADFKQGDGVRLIWPRSAMVTDGGRRVSARGDRRSRRGGISRRALRRLLSRGRKLLTSLLLLPPLLWLGIVYLGSLFALLVQSFFSLDEFSGLIVHEFTLTTYARAAGRRPTSTSSCAR